MGHMLLPRRNPPFASDWDALRVERGSARSPAACALSPAVVSALEGVTYIAEHLRAEDADLSVSADPTTGDGFISTRVKSFFCVFFRLHR